MPTPSVQPELQGVEIACEALGLMDSWTAVSF